MRERCLRCDVVPWRERQMEGRPEAKEKAVQSKKENVAVLKRSRVE